jgi:glycine/serine hydroxymethyltransferase
MEKECARVAQLMLEALANRTEEAKLDAIHQEIKQMCKKFPIPESFI